MNPKEEIVALVKTTENISLNDLVALNDKYHSILRYLIEVLGGKATTAFQGASGDVIVFMDDAGGSVFTLEKDLSGEWQGKGGLTQSLIALLAAIRVHEVDSYEWVYLPPQMRQGLVAERALNVGVSPQELKRLMAIWIA